MLEGNRVRLLVGDQMLLVSLRGVAELCPQEQILHEEAYGQKQDHYQRKATRHRLQRTAYEQAPFAATQILDHEQRQAAHGEAPTDDETKQEGAQQMVD